MWQSRCHRMHAAAAEAAHPGRWSRPRNGAQAKASARPCADSAGVEHLGSMVGMVPADPGVGGTPTAARLDRESAEWLRGLGEVGPQREAALARLHELLVHIARGEVARRGPRLRISGPELDDLACQAAADALLAFPASSASSGARAGSRRGRASS
jgi:hypothetical protein